MLISSPFGLDITVQQVKRLLVVKCVLIKDIHTYINIYSMSILLCCQLDVCVVTGCALIFEHSLDTTCTFLLLFYWLLLAISPGSSEAHLHGALIVCVISHHLTGTIITQIQNLTFNLNNVPVLQMPYARVLHPRVLFYGWDMDVKHSHWFIITSSDSIVAAPKSTWAKA